MKMAKVRVGMKVWEDTVEMELTLPAAPTSLESLLPVFERVADGLIGLAVERAVGEGRTISCAKGCGACCRQIVPISEMEARRIARLVEELPEPRRTEVRARFERARERLQDAGLLSKLRNPDGFEEGEFSPFGLAYFHLGIPCPFLEEESCSIYADRPISCREYLVTSPAANCADPKPGTRSSRVELPAKIWTALARAGSDRAAFALRSVGPSRPRSGMGVGSIPTAASPAPSRTLFRSVFGEMARRKGGEEPGGNGPRGRIVYNSRDPNDLSAPVASPLGDPEVREGERI